MGRITAIERQKKRNYFNIFLDGRFALSLPAEYLARRMSFTGHQIKELENIDIKVGQELTDKQVKSLVHISQFQRLLEKAINFISLRPRSEKEISEYLRKKAGHFDRKTVGQLVPTSNREQGGNKLIEAVLARLRQLSLVNDFEFAKWWIEQRLAFRPKGRRALEMELRQKGVAEGLIGEVLAENLKEDDLSLAIALARIKIRNLIPMGTSIMTLSLPARRRLAHFLLRRGFSWEVIDGVMRKLFKKGGLNCF